MAPTLPPRHRARGSWPGAARLACGVLLALLAGCAVPPAAQQARLDVDLPVTWSGAVPAGAGLATPLDQWWLRFEDPLLTWLVGQALARNSSIAGAQAALRQARALRDVAAAGLSPTVGANASAQRARNSGGTGNTFQLGLDAGWELDVFGANQYNLQAGDAALRASAASLGAVQISTTAEVALDYISLRGLQLRRAIAQDNLASQEETLRIAQWRQQTGLLSELEAQQARSAVEQTRAQLPLLAAGMSQMQNALAVLTGAPPATLQSVLEPVAPLPQVADALALNIPADTLRQRPDVRVAEQNVLAADARVAQAQANRAPDFRLGGSLGLGAATLGALTQGSSVVASLLGAVSVPLLDGGALRAQVRGQQAALDQTRANYRAAVLGALQEVEDALMTLRSDRERLLSLRAAASAASSAAELARQRFGSGLVDFEVVLETQRSQLGAQDSLASAIAAVSTDHVRLVKALGGGWTP